ncbi:hypothetical protein WEI85_01810 [Actinomycetes bacterium KLBMP 9797]
MNNRRWIRTGVVAFAGLGLGLAACGTEAGTGAEGPATSAPADPKVVLVAATEEIDKGNFKFDITGDEVSGGGQVHAPSRSAQLKMTFASEALSMKIDMIFIEPDSWVKIDLGQLAELPGAEALKSDKWMHVDQSKAKSLEDFSVDFDDIDPAGAEKILATADGVQKTAEGTYTGKVDLSKASDAGLVDEEVVKALGAQATTLPFEAKVDAEGRLTTLKVEIPAAGETKAHSVQVTYSDYGAAGPAKKPAASDVIEAPKNVYDILGG